MHPYLDRHSREMTFGSCPIRDLLDFQMASLLALLRNLKCRLEVQTGSLGNNILLNWLMTVWYFWWVLFQLGLIFRKIIQGRENIQRRFFLRSNIAKSNVYLQANLWKNSWFRLQIFFQYGFFDEHLFANLHCCSQLCCQVVRVVSSTN